MVHRLIVFDLIVHVWDIARATGQEIRLDPDLVRAYFAWACERGHHARIGGFGPARTIPPDAGEQTRFMAFLGTRCGRRPRSTPSRGVT